MPGGELATAQRAARFPGAGLGFLPPFSSFSRNALGILGLLLLSPRVCSSRAPRPGFNMGAVEASPHTFDVPSSFAAFSAAKREAESWILFKAGFF